jgi:quercetin dioxygenase-like cupin family protein
MIESKRLDETYVHLRNDEGAATVDVTSTFWDELTGGKRPELEQGRLVTVFHFDKDWPTWERHPAGEETVVLLTGSVTVVLEMGGAERVLTLNDPGEYVLIPPGAWHTARTSSPCSMLFITPGRGTENRPA